MPDNVFYQIAIPSPLRRLFDYLPPRDHTHKLLPGVRVKVPFGQRSVVGIIVSHSQTSDFETARIKHIDAVIDDSPLFPDVLFKLLKWAAQYYQHPLGEVLVSALPTLLRQGNPLPQQRYWRLSTHGKGLPSDALRRAPRQQELLHALQNAAALSHEALIARGISTATLRALQKKALIEDFSTEQTPTAFDANNKQDILAESPLTLSSDQQQALDKIEIQGYNTYLIDGETGCGKTEVYLQAIAKTLGNSRQALVLIPEINLTPQTVARFRSRFNCPIAVIHSGLSNKERLHAWWGAANGSAGIIIGTRSATFVPLKAPGIIIVDEEHDSSFKQQEGFKYSARDVAVMRANREQIPLILGSATPSIESLYNCQLQRYQRLCIKGRHGGATQPAWQLIDMCQLQLNAGFSEPVISAIQEVLHKGDQVLVFLNRRGFAPTLMCHGCGWIANCQHCDSHLTVHAKKPGLQCHHCENRQPLPPCCPSCNGKQLEFLGQGTERSETTLQALFPDSRVIRVDRDSTRNKGAMNKVLDEINDSKACILIGTQMLAKGHHFPDVTLVVVLDADTSLFSTDFRALEKMGQLITQVAGRAGRASKPGRVMIQSHHCEHPVFELLSKDNYAAFAQYILQERKQSSLPPFTRTVVIRAEATVANNAVTLLQQAREHSSTRNTDQAIQYFGPFPAALEKRSDRYRYQLTLLSSERGKLHHNLTHLIRWLERTKINQKLRWSIDVDPQESV